ncbi:MAG: histidine triad nucleotide-binding protein [Candidatus Aminicenantes bacterium]|jgi:histidine triad (HIT) family protein|nr:histidine triad nucleotide-binding protein [Candidatus Aminicenantes bacterium]
MDNCIFCKIINKEVPSKIVYEDERVLAFDDINPRAPIHVLLIPKEHFGTLNEIPEEKKDILSHLLLKARQIAQEKGIAENGYRIVLNTERDSGQEVFHIHFHLLGGRQMKWPPG